MIWCCLLGCGWCFVCCGLPIVSCWCGLFVYVCFEGGLFIFCDARLLILGCVVWCGLCFELLFRFRLVGVNSVVLFRLFLYVLC